MELGEVKGLGPAKIQALQAAGITSAEDLAGIDMRRKVDIDGVSQDALKRYKQHARQALRKAGREVPKARYRSKSSGKTAATQEPAISTKPSKKPEKPKRGFLRRLLRN